MVSGPSFDVGSREHSHFQHALPTLLDCKRWVAWREISSRTYIDLYLLPVRIFYGWVIAFNPYVLDKLSCTRDLALGTINLLWGPDRGTCKTTFTNTA